MTRKDDIDIVSLLDVACEAGEFEHFRIAVDVVTNSCRLPVPNDVDGLDKGKEKKQAMIRLTISRRQP